MKKGFTPEEIRDITDLMNAIGELSPSAQGDAFGGAMIYIAGLKKGAELAGAKA